MFLASGVWMILWFPLFTVIGPAFHGIAGVGLAFVAVTTWVALSLWIGFSDRFDKPFFQYSYLAVGIRERTFSYRHVGGTHLASSRIVTADHYTDCDECGTEFVDGVRENWARHVVLFGVPLVALDSETSFYCMECRPAAWGDEEPTIPTCDLKYPERSDVDSALSDAVDSAVANEE